MTEQEEIASLRELLRIAGIVAQHARAIAGGADFTTGAQIRPCGIYDIASAAERLRDALDEYDRAAVEASRCS